MALTLFLGVALANADTAPTVTIDPIAPAQVDFDSAQVSGTVNPNGGPSTTEWYFQYVAKADAEAAEANSEDVPWNIASPFGSFNEGEEVESGTGEFEIPAESTDPLTVPAAPERLEGLAPGTTYLIRLFAANAGGHNETPAIEVQTEAVNPPTASAPVISAVTTSSAHIEASVNSGGSKPGENTKWRLSCQTEGGECPVFTGTASGETDSGTDFPIEVDLANLQPHKTYTITLSAENAATRPTGIAIESASEFTTGTVPPEVETNSTHGYAYPTKARFLGTINLHNSAVQSCQFEYGTSAAYGNSVPCESYPEVAEAEAGHSDLPYTIGTEAEGLTPETTYHFRLSASNGVGPTLHGADQTLTTPPAPAPQGECPNEAIRREQEATGLPQCMAYELISPADTAGQSIVSAATGLDGDHAWVNLDTPVSGEQVSGNITTLAATRSASGWSIRDLADPATAGDLTASIEARSPDSSRAIVFSCEVVFLGCNGAATWERVDADGTRTTMLSSNPPDPKLMPSVVGVSDDLSRMIVKTQPGNSLLAADTHTQGKGLYVSHDGALEFLGLDQHGSVLPCGAILANNGNSSGAGSTFGNGFQQNGLSADATAVAFESPDPDAGCPEPVDVYLRRAGQSTDISAPRPGDPAYGGSNPDRGAVYAGNTQDGETVYFVTKTQLAPSDTDELADIYSYHGATGTVTPITDGADIKDSFTSGGKAVVVSPAGDYLYFAANRAINGQGTNGAKNLYRYHAGQIRLIAGASQGEFFLGEPIGGGIPSVTTPDGTHLLFVSSAPLTGQPTGSSSTHSKFQLFQYSAAADSLVCISCLPGGGVPTGHDISLPPMFPTANVDHRLQSDDGSTVIFPTAEALLAADTNGTLDNYLWHDGNLALLGHAHEVGAASSQVLVGLSRDGRSASFTSIEGLTSQAPEAEFKLYVARADGGFPPAQATPICEAEACRGATSPTPPQPTAATPRFSGPGNPAPKHRKKKHHKHKKHTKHHHQHRAANHDRRAAR